MIKVQYPEKCAMLLVRDCTVAICCNNNPGSILLSTLLFWHDHPRAGDYHDEKAHTFTVCRTQSEIQIQSCNQIDTKTIHDTAVPLLQLFGYLTVREKMNGNLYTLHMDRINAAYAACRNPDALHDFLKSSLQLESALIKIPDDQLESALINKRALYSQLARVLIATRADSNCKRGRKTRPQAPLDGNFPHTESNRDSSENSNKREENDTPTSSHPGASSPSSLSDLNLMSSLGSISSDSGGGNDAPPLIAASMPEVQNGYDDTSDVGEGYKTENSEMPDSDAPGEDDSPVNSDQQSVSTNETVSQAEVLSWLSALETELTEGKVKRFAVGKIAEKPSDMQRLVSAVHSLDDVRDLYEIVRSQQMFADGRIIWATNMAKEVNIALLQERAAQQVQNEQLDHEQADLFGQWLVGQGFCFENVAIDNPYADLRIWVVCVRHGDGEDSWLRIRNWYHFNHLEEWEQEQYALAEAYNDFLLSQMPVPEVLEAVAL